MNRSLNLSLTNELRSFIDEQSGDGTLYATPSEYVRSVLREKKEREEAAVVRAAILEGCEDMIQGRTVPYKSSVRETIKAAAADGLLDA